MTSLYPRGSEWRRWDLHVHGPGTALNDEFSGWDEYVAAVEAADASIVVAGITDYASIKAYKTFKEIQATGLMKNIALAIPNIEFRISPETKYGKGINLHLLVCPDDPDHVGRIEEGLSRLTIERNKEDIPCTEAGLIRLGKITKPNLLSTPAAAYQEGVNQFKVDFEQFRKWLRAEQWLSRNSLVALAVGSKDGASGLLDGGYLATRREIYAFADIIFSGNPSERDAWLGRGTIPAEEFSILRGPKPVLHGSDAHEVARLFNPTGQKYCWIKSDPTFEGLRQVLYEPEDRVWVGEAPPSTHEARSVLDRLTVDSSNGWFEDNRPLLLNSGMVAIIGLKGSGKTALADLIGFTAGAVLDEDNSFLSRAREHIVDLAILLQWLDGTPEAAVFPSSPGGESGLSVRYLSQKFVDRLCAGDTLSVELQREIESVIFQHLKPEDQMDCESFAELRKFRTDAIHENRAALRAEIQANSQQISDLDERRSSVLQKSGRRMQLPNLISTLNKGLPRVDDRATASRVEDLQKYRQRLAKAAQGVGAAKQTKQLVQDGERKIAAKITEVATFWSATAGALSQLGFSRTDISTLAPVWNKHPEIFKARCGQIDDLIIASEGKAVTPPVDSVAGLEAVIKKIEDELKMDKAKKDKIIAIEKERQKLLEEKRKLDAEFEWLATRYKTERQEVQNRRVENYLAFFDLLKEERDVLEELYSPLQSALASQGSQERKLDVVCRVDVAVDAWIAKGSELFDLRKTGTFRYDEIEAIASRELAKAWQACDPAKIEAALEKCVALIKEADVLKKQLKTGFQPTDVADWLFSIDHIDVAHGIQYEGKDLRLLSPGTKGIVLLILYLAVDRFDTRPLIVDQPDENLDNQSTYEILRGYFREAKKRRQIIIITHNPNLVVNTDAEQVIVAESTLRSDGLPRITYSCGSLESLAAEGPLDGTIREAVCRIMEGGKNAFKTRESRYGKILEN